MYCLCPGEQRDEPSAPHENHHRQPHECGPGCSGIWVYYCFHHMNSYSFYHHLSPHIDRNRLAPSPLLHASGDNKPKVRVYCKAKTDHSLTICEGKVILAPTNPSDPYQHWIKDEKFGCEVKDEEGYSSFALVNKATGQALKHSIGVKYPLQLTAYNSNVLDMSVLWSMGRNPGDGYKAIRVVNNIHLNGTARYSDSWEIVCWEWNDSDVQRRCCDLILTSWKHF